MFKLNTQKIIDTSENLARPCKAKIPLIQPWIEDWRLKIFKKTFFDPALDWRLKIENFQKTFFDPGLKIEDFQKTFFDPALDWRLKIEDFQKTFFDPALDWRLKIFKKLSSILDWRLKIEDFQKTFFNPALDLRKFSQNLQSSIQGSKKVFWKSSIWCGIFDPGI